MSGFSLKWLIAPISGVVVVAALLVNPESGAADREAATSSDPHDRAIRRQLDLTQTTTSARMTYKEELINRLIAGELSLSQVSGEFLRMNQDTVIMDMLRLQNPGFRDEEVSARNVISYVRHRRLPTQQSARVFGRLHTQYEGMFGTAYRQID